MTRTTAVVTGVLMAAVAVGAWRFPIALEPTGSERDQIVLNHLVDHGRGSVGNDWFSVSATARVQATASGVTIDATNAADHELELTSRELPVLAHNCYELSIDSTTVRAGATGAVYDEDLVTRVATLTFTAGRRTERVQFTAPDKRPITLTLYGSHASSITLRRVVLRHVGRACKSTQ